MGCTNIYEFGGIIDWDGDIVEGKGKAEEEVDMTELSFESFDGGGPEFNVIIDDESIVSYERHVQYYKDDHEQMTGAGYNVVFSFKGTAPGETKMTIEERSPIADNLDHKYKVKVDDNLHVGIETISVEEISY